MISSEKLITVLGLLMLLPINLVTYVQQLGSRVGLKLILPSV